MTAAPEVSERSERMAFDAPVDDSLLAHVVGVEEGHERVAPGPLGELFCRILPRTFTARAAEEATI